MAILKSKKKTNLKKFHENIEYSLTIAHNGMQFYLNVKPCF